MALTSAQKTRLDILYLEAVYSSRRFIQVCQADLRAALLANDAGDTAAAITPTISDNIHGMIG